MGIFTPAETIRNYAKAGIMKTERPVSKQIILSVLAGAFIAFGAAAANTAAHSIGDVSAARLISGLIFPFGLGMVLLLGAELFTGNAMLCVSVWSGDAKLSKVLRNWAAVYLGNFIGAALLAVLCAWFGQMNYSGGGLAVYTIKLAAAKSVMPPLNAFMLAIPCNVLVCAGVLCSLSAQDTAGRIAGAYLPVAFFVICGFEHCVANMYYIPAGIFAAQAPEYAALAAEAGVNLSALTWSHFFLRNLLPVTLGNLLGGAGFGAAMWFGTQNPKAAA
ncbi:MAG: formate/nitrite transporter family protein [Clostridiales bacterium]|nr:formate/nitrite transporter family protein [Clostridiales bacterium]